MSSLSNKVDVLVVGAGPTGLLTALELARAGMEVEIVDRAWRATTQSYACGLHGATLELLGGLGLTGPLLEAGQRIETMGFYEGERRCAELRFNALRPPFNFLLVVPQDTLEEQFEEALKARGVRVRWGHRLDDARQDANAVIATVEKLALTSVGYPFARSEEMVESVTEVRARYVVGADGSRSHLRTILGLTLESFGAAAAYEAFEFEPATAFPTEVRAAFGAHTVDAFWPQPGGTCRWSLQLEGLEAERPEKERQSYVVLDELADPERRAELENRVRARAPWFQAGIKEIDWTTVVGFEEAVARPFGTGRCWLVGDAAHQAGPIGMQSLNVGLREAVDLAGRLGRVLRQGASPGLLEEYDTARQTEWQALLGGHRTVKARPGASPWVKAQRGRLLSCLPGSGEQLDALLAQLGLELSGTPAVASIG